MTPLPHYTLRQRWRLLGRSDQVFAVYLGWLYSLLAVLLGLPLLLVSAYAYGAVVAVTWCVSVVLVVRAMSTRLLEFGHRIDEL